MKFEKAIKRPFEDILKTVIMSLLSSIPIINFFAFGYGMEVARSTWKKKKLPEWKNWKDLWVRGFYAFVIMILCSLPLLIFFPLIMVMQDLALILFVLLGISAFVAAIVAYYCILCYAKNYRTKDAFKKGFIKKALRKDLILAILAGYLWSVVLMIPTMVPILGFVWAVVFAQGAGAITVFTLAAQGYKK